MWSDGKNDAQLNIMWWLIRWLSHGRTGEEWINNNQTIAHNQCQNYKQLSPEWALLDERIALPLHHKSNIKFLSAALMHNDEQGPSGTWSGICGWGPCQTSGCFTWRTTAGDEVLLSSMQEDQLWNTVGWGEHTAAHLFKRQLQCVCMCV